MTVKKSPCVKGRSIGESGAAALATVAQHYGVELSLDDVQHLLGVPSLEMGLFEVIIYGKRLGFETIPLEGEYHQLPEVDRPTW
jgi:ABC-type bacteriocin/lantibiotic exporter with double-glycine peptidase domain